MYYCRDNIALEADYAEIDVQETAKDVHIWTFSEQPNALERFIYLGVDNIITDYPAELVAPLKRRAEMNDIDRLKENFLK